MVYRDLTIHTWTGARHVGQDTSHTGYCMKTLNPMSSTVREPCLYEVSTYLQADLPGLRLRVCKCLRLSHDASLGRGPDGSASPGPAIGRGFSSSLFRTPSDGSIRYLTSRSYAGAVSNPMDVSLRNVWRVGKLNRWRPGDDMGSTPNRRPRFHPGTMNRGWNPSIPNP